MATYSNLYIDQGSSFVKNFSPHSTLLSASNLVLFNASGQIRKTYNSSPAITSFQIVGSDSGYPRYPQANPINNSPFQSSDRNLQISLSPAQTSLLKAGRYVYDIELRKIDFAGNPAGTVVRVLEGQVVVTPRVTRSFE